MKLINSAKSFAGSFARQALEYTPITAGWIKALLRKPLPVHGGPPVRRFPWPRRLHFDRREKRAVLRVINREILQGNAVVYGGREEKAYCEAFAKWLGGGYAKAVNSGTNAIYVALKALDLEPGSEIIVPPITDPGGTMPVALMHCIPVAADCAPGSINTSVDQIKAVLSERTGAILIAHISGHPVDLDPILKLAAERDIPVVEDCAQAHGALYKGRPVGSFGVISAFSTMFGKHHCTGAQGGVVFTRNSVLFARVRQATDRGKPHGVVGNPSNVIASLNFNQDEISMAIGRVQLEKLPDAIKKRRAFVSLVQNGLKEVEAVSLVDDPPQCTSAYWFLILLLDSRKLTCDNLGFAAALEREGIGGVHPGYSHFPTEQPWHQAGAVFGSSGLPWSALPGNPKPQRFDLPNAHELSRHLVPVNVHERLGAREADQLVRAIKKVAGYYAMRPAADSPKQPASALTPEALGSL